MCVLLAAYMFQDSCEAPFFKNSEQALYLLGFFHVSEAYSYLRRRDLSHLYVPAYVTYHNLRFH